MHAWLLSFSICSFSLVRRSTGSKSNSDWMSRLPIGLHNVPLIGLAIPGSHDSASYSLNITGDLAPGIPDKVRDILNSSIALKGGEEFVRKEIFLWSVTQDYNISQQLELGVRYFDIRVLFKEQEDKLYTYHGLIGPSLESVLSQMAAFLQRREKEVLLLDFNHLKILTNKGFQELKRILNKAFGNRVYRGQSANVCLSELWKNNSNVIVFFRGAGHIKSTGIQDSFGFDESKILSPFNEKKFYDYSIWKEYLKENYKNRPHNRTFYVTQGIMQPNLLSIAASSLMKTGSLKTLVADGATKALVKWLVTCKSGLNGINIVISDFVQMHNFIKTVLSLNTNKTSISAK